MPDVHTIAITPDATPGAPASLAISPDATPAAPASLAITADGIPAAPERAAHWDAYNLPTWQSGPVYQPKSVVIDPYSGLPYFAIGENDGADPGGNPSDWRPLQFYNGQVVVPGTPFPMGSIIAHKGFLWEAEYDLEGTWNGSEAILEEPYAGSPFWTVLRNPVMGVVTIS